MELEQSFIALIEQSIKTNWYLNALTDYKGITLQYRDVARKIEKIHILLENAGIEKVIFGKCRKKTKFANFVF